MKKFSISFLAILAIVFAVSSAFTSTSKKAAKQFSTQYDVYGLTNIFDNPPSVGQVENGDHVIGQQTNPFNLFDSQFNDNCEDDESDPVCLAQLETIDSNDPTLYGSVRLGIYTAD